MSNLNKRPQEVTSNKKLFDAIEQGTILITANNRLALHTQKLYEQQQIKNHKKTWQTANIISWNEWLQQSWQQAVVNSKAHQKKVLLSLHQEQFLWQNIISSSKLNNPLQQVLSTAKNTQQAWQLICNWQLTLSQNNFNYNQDSLAFFQWATEFKQLCKDKNWLSNAELCDELLYHYQREELQIPKKIILLGFDELTPQQNSLFNYLETKNFQLYWLKIKPINAHISKICCDDNADQFDTLARWLKNVLLDNSTNNVSVYNQIAIIVPELSKHRQALIHAIDNIINPQNLQTSQHYKLPFYNISLGLPLSNYPIVSDAFKILELFQTSIKLETITNILNSPFIAGWQQETSARALLDGKIISLLEPKISLSTLIFHALQQDKAYYCPLLASRLSAWKQLKSELNSYANPAIWTTQFNQLFNVIGWAKGRSLSSDEFQTVTALQKLLVKFASLDLVAAKWRFSNSISQLKSLANQQLFQAKTQTTQVQILGLLEANGLQFEHIWLMGVDDKVLPAPAKPNPFIPITLQQQNNLPHCSATQNLVLAKKSAQQIFNSAKQVFVSYIKQQADEAFLPSPVISDIPLIHKDKLNLCQQDSWYKTIFNSGTLEILSDDLAPALQQSHTHGGSYLFKQQACCAFRAFAEIRLFAKFPEKNEIGLPAMIRGNIVHSVLEKIWNKIKNQNNLLSISESNLEKLVADYCSIIINKFSTYYPQTLKKQFIKLEIKRIKAQVITWLNYEKSRSPFYVISNEEKVNVTISELNINLKIDRIDKLEDGSLLIIDYKTGLVKPAHWFSDRPDEPQLPLYSMAFDSDVSGISFVQIRAGDIKFVGLSRVENLAQGITYFKNQKQTKHHDNWSEVLNEWQLTLTKLANDFKQGVANVQPKNKNISCLYCALSCLCRIDEVEKNAL